MLKVLRTPPHLSPFSHTAAKFREPIYGCMHEKENAFAARAIRHARIEQVHSHSTRCVCLCTRRRWREALSLFLPLSPLSLALSVASPEQQPARTSSPSLRPLALNSPSHVLGLQSLCGRPTDQSLQATTPVRILSCDIPHVAFFQVVASRSDFFRPRIGELRLF